MQAVCRDTQWAQHAPPLAQRTRDVGTAGDHCTPASALPDLILLDLQLPSMSGPELMRAVAHRTATPPPVIVVSARRDADAIAAADAIGARAVVLKPFAVDDLLDRIAAVERGLRQGFDSLCLWARSRSDPHHVPLRVAQRTPHQRRRVLRYSSCNSLCRSFRAGMPALDRLVDLRKGVPCGWT